MSIRHKKIESQSIITYRPYTVCDGCNLETDDVQSMGHNKKFDIYIDMLDLCEDCIESLHKHLNDGKIKLGAAK